MYPPRHTWKLGHVQDHWSSKTMLNLLHAFSGKHRLSGFSQETQKVACEDLAPTYTGRNPAACRDFSTSLRLRAPGMCREHKRMRVPIHGFVGNFRETLIGRR